MTPTRAVSDRLHVLGIRHHGPGSATSLARALDALDPEEILVEGPQEATEMIGWAARGVEPPVALLVYDEAAPSRAVFYPFAEWSPEWIAIRWALARRRPVRFMDFPVGAALRERAEAEEAAAKAMAKAEEERAKGEGEAAKPGEASPGSSGDGATGTSGGNGEGAQSAPESSEAIGERPGTDGRAAQEATPGPDNAQPVPPDPGDEEEASADAEDPEAVRGDPLSRLAQAAGQEDGEAWWSSVVEESGGDAGIFAVVEEAMAALREAGGMRPDDDRREAHMRAAVAEALERTTGPVAAVVGAWHAPALRGGPRKGDKTHLSKGKKAVRTAVTWVTWTDARLALASGYGAGVRAPGWYRTLWATRRQASGRDLAIRWQTQVAHALRAKDRPAATSSIIDAVCLAEALAAVRGRARPGLDEMRDASLATLCHGDEVPWQLIARQLLEGTHIGVIPDDMPVTPLRADFEQQLKKLKLKRDADAASLDLRSDVGQAKSWLLHRLALLGVPWGRLEEGGGSRGTFRETWTLRWEPELDVKLVEGLRWGTTILSATNARVAETFATETDLSELATAVLGALEAGLDPAVDVGVGRIADLAAAGAEVVDLCKAVPPLVDVLRYGTAREQRLDRVEALVSGLLDKVDVGLQHACRHLEPAAAVAVRDALGALDPAIRLFQDGARAEDWTAALDRVADDPDAAPLVSGWCTRRLHDRAAWSDDRVATRLHATLSPGVPLAEAAGWLEGFLGEAAHILLHDDRLLGIVDDWLVGLSEDGLMEALPLLRRATSGFGGPERTRLLRMIAGEQRATPLQEGARSSEAFEAGMPLLARILGIEEAS